MKKLCLKLFIFSFTVLVSLEIGSFALIKLGNLAPQGLGPAYKHELPAWFDDARNKTKFGDAYRFHHFWGHRYNMGNNHGFDEDKDLPYSKKKGELVVGIFGGSTASHWANWLKKKNFFKNKGHDNIVVLNLAISVMKQPQQFAVASRFLEMLDVALFYDGYNDVVSDPCPQDPESSSVFKYLTQLKPNEEFWFRGKLLKILTLKILSSPLHRSHFVFFAWDKFRQATYRRLQQIKSDVRKQESENKFAKCLGTLEERIENRFEIWQKYTQLSKLIADRYSVRMLHFLQPDPFKKNVKDLSENEKNIVNWQRNNYQKFDTKGFETQRFRELYQKNPLKYGYDLSEIFKETKEPTYIDAHSHLNNRGNQILSEKVFKIMQREGIIPGTK